MRPRPGGGDRGQGAAELEMTRAVLTAFVETVPVSMMMTDRTCGCSRPAPNG